MAQGWTRGCDGDFSVVPLSWNGRVIVRTRFTLVPATLLTPITDPLEMNSTMLDSRLSDSLGT